MARDSLFSSWSLTARVVALSSLWALVAIAILGWILVGNFRANAEQNFDELQLAQFYALVGGIDIGPDGALSGRPDLGDPAFGEAGSGWYWRVYPVDEAGASIASASLSDVGIVARTAVDVPFDRQFTRRYMTTDTFGQQLRVFESEIEAGNNRIVRFLVAGNEDEFDATIRSYAGQTAALLGVFTLGVIAINALIILLGLKPLDGIRAALSSIRAGRAQRLDGKFPSEIRPLVEELNALIENNRRILARSRTQVGNLAHSLKTPLAVLVNEADASADVPAKIVDEQARTMQYQVQHYLDRARIAAQRESVVFRTDATAAAGKLLSVMRKLNPQTSFELEKPVDPVLFAGEHEDFDEVLGNLLENAAKWADSKVEISIGPSPTSQDGRAQFIMSVRDDGPGIAPQERKEALRRGRRLDESVPGTGLGLAIVLETVESYGGSLQLEASDTGGLNAIVTLPQLLQ